MQTTHGRWAFVVGACCLLTGVAARAQGPAKDVVAAMLVQEHEAASHKDNFMYLSNERSDRTGGRLWTERVVETMYGRVRFLMEEDGKPISPERMKQERARLANDAAHPDVFARREQAQKDDEAHAREMLDLLGKGFILENMKEQDGDWRIDFRPDPNFSPSGIEQRVLYGMSGWMLVDEREMRLQHIEGRVAQDFSIDLGLVSIKAGSNFETTRATHDGEWKTARVISDVRGRAALFKSISRSQDVARTEFKRVENALTVAQAVALAEQ